MDNLDLDSIKSFVDTLWVIDCAILVFIMQAGFMCMETGLSRHKNSINVALKNAADFGLAVVVLKNVVEVAAKNKLSDDLTLISIGK